MWYCCDTVIWETWRHFVRDSIGNPPPKKKTVIFTVCDWFCVPCWYIMWTCGSEQGLIVSSLTLRGGGSWGGGSREFDHRSPHWSEGNWSHSALPSHCRMKSCQINQGCVKSLGIINLCAYFVCYNGLHIQSEITSCVYESVGSLSWILLVVFSF